MDNVVIQSLYQNTVFKIWKWNIIIKIIDIQIINCNFIKKLIEIQTYWCIALFPTQTMYKPQKYI